VVVAARTMVVGTWKGPNMNHCDRCTHRIWPWQSRGWRVISRESTTYWHSTCAALPVVRKLAAASAR
jgi:hypothetical protein